ncbi:MAG: hypothetical protein AVDCRST_MAG68-1470 [uncultured Gemmatimonadetes bacterium]|uniref:DUF1572 domain-containing protein n=1 Tax=uncultured Gemmatimonadota bacterium TaxID=203437 RepID=A0A6J4KU28_9BACT|nr:MAG: hypothetical protein AVDCRST_MAG68-1470 [uncultured Gemmatimonadota bacterium]
MGDGIRAEYLRESAVTMRKHKVLADESLARVSDAQFFAALDAESNSLAVLVKHVAGNLLSRWTDLLTTDGEKPDRDRDTEFEIAPSDTRAGLMRRWEAGWACAFGELEALTPADLDRTIHIRGEPHTLVQAINRQIAHAAYHTGQIVFLAKHLQSGTWQSLSIPRGQSGQFNAAMLSAPPPNPRL